MKKLMVLSAIVVVTMTPATTANAQDVARGVFIKPATSAADGSNIPRGEKIMVLNEVNMRAARDFGESFHDAKNPVWVKGQHVMSVYFVWNGFKMRSTYDKNGRKEYTLKYYGETEMTPSLRHLIRSRFYDHHIILVTEIDRNGEKYHLVKLENDSEYVTVKVDRGEVLPFEKLKKLKK